MFDNTSQVQSEYEMNSNCLKVFKCDEREQLELHIKLQIYKNRKELKKKRQFGSFL